MSSETASPCLLIAEVAQAHEGSLETAHAFIDSIAEAGADAVKFQTHIAAAESTPSEPWRVHFSERDATRYDYWKRMEFSRKEWAELKSHAEKSGLLFLSSPFSLEAVELLRDLGVEAWKIASGEVGNLDLLHAVAATGERVFLSTGMSRYEEIDEAARIFKAAEAPVTVLQCTSDYPCPPENVGLNMLRELAERYDCPVGLSDHSGTIFPALAAATLGAAALEVHVTPSRESPGPDVPASLTFEELAQLVTGVRFIGRMLENPVEKDAAAERLQPMRDLFTRSLVARRSLAAGTLLAAGDLIAKKPGTGMPPSALGSVLGRRLAKPLQADDLLAEGHLEPPERLRETES